jgi:hypothetical protein
VPSFDEVRSGGLPSAPDAARPSALAPEREDESGAGGDHRLVPAVDGVDDLVGVDALRAAAGPRGRPTAATPDRVYDR